MKYLEVRKVKLVTLTPLHIGSGQNIPKYSLVTIGEKIFVLDVFKFSESLLKISGESGVNNFVSALMSDPKTDTRQLLTKIVRDNAKLESLVENSCAYSIIKAHKRDLNEMNFNLSTHVRDANYNLYIPGSSIKGFLRTAFMYVLLKRQIKERRGVLDSLKSEIERKLKNIQQSSGKNKEKELTKFAQELEKRFFSNFNLKVPDAPQGVKNFEASPNTDIFRVLRISDTNSIHKDSAFLEMVLVYKRGKPTGIKMTVEAIPAGKEFFFTMAVDWGLFEKFVPKNNFYEKEMLKEMLADPLKVAEEFVADLLEYERSVAPRIIGQNVYNFDGQKPNLHLGFGGDFVIKTINLLFDDVLRSAILSLSRRGRWDKNDPIPSSRKVTFEMKPLGWVRADYT